VGQDRQGFQSRLAQFVAIAASHQIKPLFVLFDSCWTRSPSRVHSAHRGPVSTTPLVQSPGAERIDDRRYSGVLRDYVTECWANSVVITVFWAGTLE